MRLPREPKSPPLPMFVQFCSGLTKNFGSFPAREPKIDQVVLLKSREQTIPGQVRELGRSLRFLARSDTIGTITEGGHLRLVPKRLAEVLSFFQGVKADTGFVAE